jgi:hypothetical protein
VKVISEDVLLGSGERLPTGRLKLPDVLLGHIDEERQIGRVTPKADYTVSNDHGVKAYSPWVSSRKRSLFFSSLRLRE